MKSKTKKHGAIFLVAAVAAVPVTGTLLFFAAFILHGVYTEWLGTVLLDQILPVINPDAPHRVFVWIDECFLLFWGVTFNAVPVLLYSAIVRFVTPKAESVYLTPRLSLWVNFASAACGTGIVAAIQLWITLVSESCTASYPHRKIALCVFLPIVFIAFLALALVYIFSWHRKNDSEGNSLPIRVIFLDILRGFLALPGYALMAGIGYNLLLILFSDAF